jgi:AraC-like DNA-binding protein
VNHTAFRALSTNIRGVVAVAAQSDKTFARHSHIDFGIGRMMQGAQRSWSGRGMVEARPGDVITVNPGEVHDGAPIGEGRSWTMLYLAADIVGSIATDVTDGGTTMWELEAPVVRDARLSRAFAAAYCAVTVSAGVDADEAPLILLVASLMRQQSASTGIAHRLKLVRERIDDDPSAPHPLQDLASLADLSRFQAIRGFLRMTGLTPHAYVIQRRLDLACRLIRTGTALAETAATAGFADQSHLHRAFTTRFGLTPGAFALASAPPCNFVQ